MGAEEFRPEYGINKQRDVCKMLPQGTGYGEVFIYDEFAPDENYNFDGEGLSQADFDSLLYAALQRNGASTTLTDEATTTDYTGKTNFISVQRIGGSGKLTFKIGMRKE